MIKLFIYSFFLFSISLHALEVDEKLTGRILKISESRKTILVNRGSEDGLADGDHAKFYTTEGVVARGVIVKVSPSRSVWSMYRLVNADVLNFDTVIKLKITPAIKITKDESKMIVKDDSAENVLGRDPRDLGIPLADGADDLQMATGTGAGVATSPANINAFQVEPKKFIGKPYEVWGTIRFDNYRAVTSPDDGSGDFSSSEQSTVLTLGGEYFLADESKWWSRFTPVLFLSIGKSNLLNFQGSNAVDNSTEYGFGVNWYPITLPSMVNTFIPFGLFTYSLGGSVTSTHNPGIEGSSSDSETSKGKISGYSLGGGVKYYVGKGYGMKAALEYVNRVDSFEADEYGTTWTRTRVGPRIFVALLYRF